MKMKMEMDMGEKKGHAIWLAKRTVQFQPL